jgi:hypothetical protein
MFTTNLDPAGYGQPANLVAPEARRFRWMISSYHIPEEYQAPVTLRRESPWYLTLRCILINLPEQPESGIGTWRDYQVQQKKGEMKFLARRFFCHTFPRLKWGRRIVFSEQTKDDGGGPRWLTGDWLIVAYLWSGSREWLRCANVGSLLTLRNAFR